MSGAPKMTPFSTFSIIGHMLAYGLNVPQTSPKIRLLAVIKSVLWFVSNGQLVAEICSFQVLRWWSAAKLGLHLVYMLGYWLKLCVNLAKTHLKWYELYVNFTCKLYVNFFLFCNVNLGQTWCKLDSVVVILRHIFYDTKDFKASKILVTLILTLFFDNCTVLECRFYSMQTMCKPK